MLEQQTKIKNKFLLKNRQVIEEINRHQWLESEKAGFDIGFDQAAEDWLNRFSIAWMRYHMPEKVKTESAPKAKPKSKPSLKTTAKRRARPKANRRKKGRSAKTYLK